MPDLTQVLTSLGSETIGKGLVSASNSWFCIGYFPINCLTCSQFYQAVFDDESDSWAAGVLLVCSNCAETVRAADVGSDARRLIADYWKAVDGRSRLLAIAQAPERENASLAQKRKPSNSSEFALSEEFQSVLDEGFRIVAWLKPAEAQAVVEAYKKRKNMAVKRTDGTTAAIASWYSASESVAMKAPEGAQVQLTRTRRSGATRAVGWLEEWEAKAILDSHADRTEYLLKIGTEVVGRIYFAEDGSPEQQKYLSNTCLLRKTKR